MFNEAYDLLVRRLYLEATSPSYGQATSRRRQQPPILQAIKYSEDLRRLVSELEALLLMHVLSARADRMDATREELLARIFDDIAVVFRRAVTSSWTTTAQSVDEHNRRELDGQWRSVLGIDYPERGSVLRDSLERSREENIDLITNMTREQLEIVKLELRRMGPGAQVVDIAKMLRERMGVTRSRANLIARDQVLKLNSNLTRLRHEEAGVERYTWSAVMDERTRQSTDKNSDSFSKFQDHRSLNGKIFSWNDPPVVNKKTGDRAHPGEYFQCRCTPDPVFDLRTRR